MPLQPMPLYWPDIASLLVWDLRAALPSDVVVGVDLTGWTRPTRHVQLYRYDGTQRGAVEVVSLQVAARANSQNAAYDLADHVRHRLADAALRIPELVRCSETVGLQWLPDPEDVQPRYLFGVQAVVRGSLSPLTDL